MSNAMRKVLAVAAVWALAAAAVARAGDSASMVLDTRDGTYEFAADGDEYGAHVDGESVAAVFTDPASEHFGTPAFETVEATADGWRVGLNPAYRTTPFELWTATGLDGARGWDWKKAEAGEYRFDAETGAVEWPGGTKGVRVFRFRFRARE